MLELVRSTSCGKLTVRQQVWRVREEENLPPGQGRSEKRRKGGRKERGGKGKGEGEGEKEGRKGEKRKRKGKEGRGRKREDIMDFQYFLKIQKKEGVFFNF